MTNLKILIVDDDTLVRIALKTLVNWEENGFTLVGEAGDGKLALEQIGMLSPDIVMLDVQMPIMNGIELLKEISKMKNPPRVVVLSSHDDLDLVKQAMKLGASDYLLKLNIDFNHVIEVMEHIADEIIEERKNTSSQKDLNYQIERNINVLRKSFFKDLLDEFYQSEDEMNRKMNLLDINFYGDTRYCYVIYAEEFINFNHIKKENAPIRKFATINIIEEIVGGYCFELDSGEFVVFTSKLKDSQELSVKSKSRF